MAKTYGYNLFPPLAGSAASLRFADLMVMSGNFNSAGSVLGFDSAGWPLKVDGTAGIPTTQIALQAHLPAGDYTLTASGAGSIKFGGGFDGQGQRTIVFDGSGTPQTVNLANASIPGVILLSITASTAGNHLHDLKFILPGHSGRIFYQKFLDQFAGFRAIRFMDDSVTNFTTVQNWTDPQRIGSGFAFSIRDRISEEYQVALLNEIKQYNGQNVDYWVCLPHFATATGAGNYVQGLHDLIQNGTTIDGHTIAPLNAGSIVYDETSNETWNNFSQQGQMNARRAGADAARVAQWQVDNAPKTMGGFEYIAHIKAYLGRKFKDLFANSGRIVKTTVMSQGVVPAFGQVEINHFALPNLFDGGTTTIDVLGAGLYQHPGIASGAANGVDLAALAVLYATNPAAALDQYFATQAPYTGFLKPLLAQYKTKANAIGAEFAVYEWGEDSNAFFLPAGSPARTNMQVFLKAARYDPRFQALVVSMDAALPDGGPHMWFQDCTPYGDFLWGAVEFTGQTGTPSLLALQSLVAGSPDPGPGPDPDPDPGPDPDPTPDPIPDPIPMADLLTAAQATAMLAASGRELNPAQLAVLADHVAEASEAVRRWCGDRDFNRKIYDRVYSPALDGTIALDQFPVNAVLRVSGGRTQALTITQSDTAATRATVGFASTGDEATGLTYTGLILRKTVAGIETANTILYSTNATLSALATAIGVLGGGWSATVNTSYLDWPSADLVGADVAVNARGVVAPLEVYAEEIHAELDRRTGQLWVGRSGYGYGFGGGFGFGGGTYRGTAFDCSPGRVRVVYDAGFDVIPAPVRQATSLVVGKLLDDAERNLALSSEAAGRASYVVNTAFQESDLPKEARALLAPYRVIRL